MTELKKNGTIELEITDIGVNGEGIGKCDGCTFFVKDAVIGDRVKAVITLMKKGYGYARLTEVLDPSDCRIEAPCPEARRCGGCQIMEMSYDAQLKYKENKVRANLEKIGGFKDPKVLPVIGMDGPGSFSVPVRYRNKMQYPIGRDRNGNIVAGFYAGRTHSIIDTEDCRVAPEVCGKILHAVTAFLTEHDISVYNEKSGQGLVRHLVLRTGFRTGEIMICLVLNGRSLNENSHSKNSDLDAAFAEKMRTLPLVCGCRGGQTPEIASICINTNRENTNVILGKEIRCLYGRPFIYDEICMNDGKERLRFKISPLSFYQVNPVQMEKLYAKALEFAELSGQETVWDLYCGTGTISLFLAKQAGKVKGVEIVPDAIRDAKENALMNGIENAEFFCGRSEEVFPAYRKGLQLAEEAEKPHSEKSKAAEQTVVVLDPPRKGCDRVLLNTLIETGPERIVYVSCDSATLARDLKILTGGAESSENKKDRAADMPRHFYAVEKIQPVDMFPNSVHVETVALLSRRKDEPRIQITMNL